MGIQESDRIVEVDGHKVTSWEDVQTDTILARTNVIPVVIEHNGVPTTCPVDRHDQQHDRAEIVESGSARSCHC